MQFDSSMAGYHLVLSLGCRLFVCCRLVVGLVNGEQGKLLLHCCIS